MTFQKVQEEIARRVGKRKTSSKAKTELGKYSGKYALSERMTCGECGSPYRRQTYMPHGEKIYVWRCLNPMENGRRLCKCSPTFAEQDIYDAVVAAMNEMLSQNKVKEILKASISTVLAAAEPELSLPAVESRIRVLQKRQIELYQMASAKNELYDDEIGKIHAEKMKLMQRKAELEKSQATNVAFDNRISEIDTALDRESGAISEYDDARVRQLISNIKAVDKETLLIRFKDGTEITHRLENRKITK